MPQVGTEKVDTPSGPVVLPVYDTTDIADDYLRVNTPSGAGAIPVRDPSNAAHNFFRVYTEEGTKALHNTKGVEVDNFEDGDVAEWSNAASAGFNATAAAAYQGGYGGELIGAETQDSLSGLNSYPRAGDTFETYFQFFKKSAGPQTEIYWGVSDNDTSHNNGFRVRSVAAGMYLDKMFQGTNVESTQFTNINTNDSKWYRCTVDWGVDGSITVTIDDLTDDVTSSISTTDYIFREGGIGTHANSAANMNTDEWIIKNRSIPYNPAVDDFNVGNLDSWDDDPDATLQYSERIEGEYGLHFTQNNPAYASSLPSSSANYDATLQPNTLPYYPSAGDEFMFWAKLNGFNSGTVALSKFDFGCADYSSLGSYSVFFDWPNNYWRIEYDDANDNQTTLGESSTLEVNAGAWYLYRVQWGSGGSLEAQQYNSSFTQTDSLPAMTDTSRSAGGLYLWTNSNVGWSIDNIRTLQRGAL